MESWGLTGWQWMFVAEAVPAVLLGFYILKALERPAARRQMAGGGRARLAGTCGANQPASRGVWEQIRAILNRRAGLLSAIYLTRNMAMYGVSLFLPLILSGAGLSNKQVGFAATIPFLTAALGAVAWAWSSDRFNERHWHVIAATRCWRRAAFPSAPSWARQPGRWSPFLSPPSGSMPRPWFSGRCRP